MEEESGPTVHEAPACSCCYTIQSIRQNTYVGVTNDLPRRLRQHNGQLSGGAKSTRGRGPWEVAFFVRGFKDRGHALSFEWAMKHTAAKHKIQKCPRSWRSIFRRVCVLCTLMHKPRFTSRCPDTKDFHYVVEMHPSLLQREELRTLLDEHMPAYVSVHAS